MELVLDRSLKLMDPNKHRAVLSNDNKLFDIITSGGRAGKVVLRSTIPETATAYHKSVFDYFDFAWSHHAGVVMRPDIFYFVVLNNLAKFVFENPVKCRHLLTTKNGDENKETIEIKNERPDLSHVIAALVERMPVKMNELIFNFSTDTLLAKEARLACFSEAASQFYEYAVSQNCGIPAVRLEGSASDWQLVCSGLEKWHVLLSHLNSDVRDYITTARRAAWQLLNDARFGTMTVPFWQDIFKRRGIEHYDDTAYYLPSPTGWFADVMNNWRFVKMRDGGFTAVEWKQTKKKKRFVMFHGLFSSKLDDHKFLVPSFGRFVCEKF